MSVKWLFSCSSLWIGVAMSRINTQSPLQMNAEALPCFFLYSLCSYRSYVKFSDSLLALSHRNQFFRCPANSHLSENMIPAPHGDLSWNNLSCCVHKVTYGTLNGNTACTGVFWLSRALCRDQGFAVSKAKPWKCENSHCLKDFSELRALCEDIYGW